MGGGVDPTAVMALAGGGGAPAMPGMFGPGAGAPPVPGRNPMFSDPAGDANGARLIKSNPGMASAFGAMMSKPSGPTAGVPAPGDPVLDVANAADPAKVQAATSRLGGDSGGSFESKPWSPVESVMGNDVTGQNWKPSRGSVVLPEATPNAAPAGPANTPPAPSMFGPGGKPPSPTPPLPVSDGQSFDTSAPAAKGGLFGINLPGQDLVNKGLKQGPTNPLFQTGMGLLASGYDGSNPYTNIASNLRGIQPHEIALRSAGIADSAEGRKKKDAADEAKDAEIRALMAQMMMSGMPGVTAGAAAGSGATAGSQGQARLVR